MGFLSEIGGTGTVSAGLLLAFVVWLIVTGKLIPRSYYAELKGDRDYWRQAAEAKDKTVAEMVTQQSAIVDALATTQKLIESLEPPPGG